MPPVGVSEDIIHEDQAFFKKNLNPIIRKVTESLFLFANYYLQELARAV